ncbi:uncharacterized protein LOC125537967 [Triticum urartu]|nr:uncharacterized protein LOC125537967 [Triticum urartu]
MVIPSKRAISYKKGHSFEKKSQRRRPPASALTPTAATTGDFASDRRPLSSPPLVADRATTAVWAGGTNALLSAEEPLPPGQPHPSVACSPPAASSPSTQTTEVGGGTRLCWRGRGSTRTCSTPPAPSPFRAHAGVPAYAYNGQDREANEVMPDDEHLLEDILLEDAPLRQHLQRVINSPHRPTSREEEAEAGNKERVWVLILAANHKCCEKLWAEFAASTAWE